MTKIYTPEEWRSYFRCPSIVINDEGYIYSAEEYSKMIRSPIGRIDYEKNYIYGSDYAALMPVPIAYMVRSDDEIKIYEYGKVYGSAILYIKNNKIYTPDEYFRWFGGNASGHIENEEKGGKDNRPNVSDGSSGGGVMPGGRLMAFLGVALIVGIIYILSDEGRVANTATILALLWNAGTIITLLVKKVQGKLYFSWDSKRFGKGVLMGIGIYVAACAILVVLGLGSNLGTGNHISDKGGNQLELAAMLFGIPSVISSLFVSTPPSGYRKSSGKAKQFGNFGNRSTNQNFSGQKQVKQSSDGSFKQLLGTNVKIAKCFYCKKTFTVKFPPQVREMAHKCPKCGNRNIVSF